MLYFSPVTYYTSLVNLLVQAELFLETLKGFEAASKTDPTLPELDISVFCTRAEKGAVLTKPMIAGS